MVPHKLISFDLKADFGFFKKPDYNDGLLLTYNMLHKPALLGILGAIAGMAGYKRKKELPEYYTKLCSMKIGIEPIGHEKGNFQKTLVKYTNTVGYANRDGNLLVEETMLVKPGYRCYLLLDMQNDNHRLLFEFISGKQAEYIPYMGKNEYQAWIDDNVQEYEFKVHTPDKEFEISSVFVKEDNLVNQQVKPVYSFSQKSMTNQGSFCYFERLPIGFDEQLMQYSMYNFSYTNWVLKADTIIPNLYMIKNIYAEKVIQLF